MNIPTIVGKVGIHMQKNEISPLPYTIHKNQHKMVYKDLNTRPQTIKLLEEKI